MNEITIFYADDDEDDILLFTDAVASISQKFHQPIQLHIHKNGENLLVNLKELNPKNGVVFLDLNMPKKSGLQFLKDIRDEVTTQQFPVVIYSTSSSKLDIELSLNLGANHYAVKPYNFNDLIKMIYNVATINWADHYVNENNFLLQK
ncbi:response regulator [Flavobacterium sp. 7A]|uniref:response regulator n=1 Tax=Flavobacterium sp. 7A TaxID=2940571 RepID=UPI0022271B9C|nr:response regulator [Flavobacterium sp. 7A]MCW2119873.1 CheY-like chemotaxis protein [Flavobacterium sp. 7A]